MKNIDILALSIGAIYTVTVYIVCNSYKCQRKYFSVLFTVMNMAVILRRRILDTKLIDLSGATLLLFKFGVDVFRISLCLE